MELPASRTAVKICGLTNREDALAAIDAGADFLGFNTWAGTKRFIDLEANADWITGLPPHARRVALLVNASREETAHIAAFPFVDVLQFHGDEDAAFCKWAAELGKPIIKVIRAGDAAAFANAATFSTPHILLDAHVPGEFGGTGARVDVDLVKRFQVEYPALNLWLAGGLTPENVGETARTFRPAVVDVSSGVESAVARKDVAKMRAFVAATKSC